MYNKTDLQYPEHARANEPVKGRKTHSNNRSFHNAGPFLSASLAGVVMFSYLSSHELGASADNPPVKLVAAAIVEPSFKPFPESVSEPAEREEKNLQSLPSPEPAPIRNPIRVPAPTPEPTPDPIVEDLNEPVTEPTPTPSDPEPDPTPAPEPQADPVITTDSVINISIKSTDDGLISSNIRKFSVELNKIADGRAKVTLFVRPGEEYIETGDDGVAVYNTDGKVESGVWSGEVKYSFVSERVISYPAKLVMEYEQSDGTTGSEEIDGFDVYSISSWVEYEEGSLTFAYPRDLFSDSEHPENSINNTSLQCTTDDGPVSSSGPEIGAESFVFLEYELEEKPEEFKYEATVQLETIDESGSTVEMQITNEGTFGE